MKHYAEAVSSATHDLARLMTVQVRQRALAEGWEPEVARDIALTFDGSKFDYHLGESHKDRAFVHEFGDERTPPKATIRRHINGARNNEENFRQLVNANLKKASR